MISSMHNSILSTLVLSLGAYFGRPSSKKTNEGLSFAKPYSRATSASSILTKLTRGANVDISSSIVSNISKIRKSKFKLKQLLPDFNLDSNKETMNEYLMYE